MSPTLDFHRTFVRYEEDGHRLDIPIEFEHVEPDVIAVAANDLDQWDEPQGLALPPAKRDAIVAFLRQYLDSAGTVYTVDEAEYLRRRGAPFQVRFEGSAGHATLAYIRGAQRADFALRDGPDSALFVQLRTAMAWTAPAGAALSDADRRAIESDIRSVYPVLQFE